MPYLTNCLTQVEVGCLGYRGASTVASQLLDRILSPWLAIPGNPATSPHSRHPSHLLIRDGREGRR